MVGRSLGWVELVGGSIRRFACLNERQTKILLEFRKSTKQKLKLK